MPWDMDVFGTIICLHFSPRLCVPACTWTHTVCTVDEVTAEGDVSTGLIRAVISCVNFTPVAFKRCKQRYRFMSFNVKSNQQTLKWEHKRYFKISYVYTPDEGIMKTSLHLFMWHFIGSRWSSYTSDLKISSPVATLPKARRYGLSGETGWSGVTGWGRSSISIFQCDSM